MACREYAELIDLYVDGTLAEETAARVDRHLLRCAECAFEVRGIEQTRRLLQTAMPAAESSPAFREKMAARLHDAFSDVLRTEPAVPENQWALPFPRETD